MASMDIFNSSAFSMTSLTGAVTKVGYKPQLLGSLNLFEPMPVRTRTVFVDRQNQRLTLIPSSPVGAPPKELVVDPRNAVPLKTTRLAEGFTLYAEEVQGNLVETLTANTSETIASGFVNHLIKGLDDAVPGNGARIATFVANRGASSLAQISPGSATFRALIAGVQMTAEAEAAAGRRVVVPGVLFMQGESNIGTSGFEYAEQLERYRRTLEAEVQRVTGQADPVVLFIGQTNAVEGYLPLDRQAIQLCQVDAAQRYPFIRLAGPVYALPMEASSDAASSLVHKSPIGANRMGQMFARAVQAEIFGRGWSTFAPYDARFVSTTVLELRYRVPVRPLVIDTTGDVAISGMATTRGFDVLEANAPAPNQTSTDPTFASTRIGIASVATFKTNPHLGEDAVRITLSAAPVSPWVHVAYALRRDDPNSTQDGPVSGARGCIRDSAAHASLYDAHVNHNWAAAWCQPVRSFQ